MQYYAHVAHIVRVNDSGQHSNMVLRVRPDFGATLP